MSSSVEFTSKSYIQLKQSSKNDVVRPLKSTNSNPTTENLQHSQVEDQLKKKLKKKLRLSKKISLKYRTNFKNLKKNRECKSISQWSVTDVDCQKNLNEGDSSLENSASSLEKESKQSGEEVIVIDGEEDDVKILEIVKLDHDLNSTRTTEEMDTKLSDIPARTGVISRTRMTQNHTLFPTNSQPGCSSWRPTSRPAVSHLPQHFNYNNPLFYETFKSNGNHFCQAAMHMIFNMVIPKQEMQNNRQIQCIDLDKEDLNSDKADVTNCGKIRVRSTSTLLAMNSDTSTEKFEMSGFDSNSEIGSFNSSVLENFQSTPLSRNPTTDNFHPFNQIPDNVENPDSILGNFNPLIQMPYGFVQRPDSTFNNPIVQSTSENANGLIRNLNTQYIVPIVPTVSSAVIMESGINNPNNPFINNPIGNPNPIAYFNTTSNLNPIENQNLIRNCNPTVNSNLIENSEIIANSNQLVNLSLFENFNPTPSLNQISNLNTSGNSNPIGSLNPNPIVHSSPISNLNLNNCLNTNLNPIGNYNPGSILNPIGNSNTIDNLNQNCHLNPINNSDLMGNSNPIGNLNAIENSNPAGTSNPIVHLNPMDSITSVSNSKPIENLRQSIVSSVASLVSSSTSSVSSIPSVTFSAASVISSIPSVTFSASSVISSVPSVTSSISSVTASVLSRPSSFASPTSVSSATYLISSVPSSVSTAASPISSIPKLVSLPSSTVISSISKAPSTSTADFSSVSNGPSSVSSNSRPTSDSSASIVISCVSTLPSSSVSTTTSSVSKLPSSSVPLSSKESVAGSVAVTENKELAVSTNNSEVDVSRQVCKNEKELKAARNEKMRELSEIRKQIRNAEKMRKLKNKDDAGKKDDSVTKKEKRMTRNETKLVKNCGTPSKTGLAKNNFVEEFRGFAQTTKRSSAMSQSVHEVKRFKSPVETQENDNIFSRLIITSVMIKKRSEATTMIKSPAKTKETSPLTEKIPLVIIKPINIGKTREGRYNEKNAEILREGSVKNTTEITARSKNLINTNFSSNKTGLIDIKENKNILPLNKKQKYLSPKKSTAGPKIISDQKLNQKILIPK